jgi:hypothetical protein
MKNMYLKGEKVTVQKEGGLRAPSPAPQEPSAKAEVGAIRCFIFDIKLARGQALATYTDL